MKKMIIISVLLVIGFTALFMYREYTREVKSATSSNPDFRTDAKVLVPEFASNDAYALAKYSGKLIEVSGPVSSTEINSQPVIVLGNDPQIKIRCVFDELNDFPAAGSSVVIRGYCTGFNKDELIGSDIMMNRCAIIKSSP
jgi:hypothetical protein